MESKGASGVQTNLERTSSSCEGQVQEQEDR
jgi:hypothetical protein